MTLMLPFPLDRARSITGVAGELLAGVQGAAGARSAATSAVVVVIDGLGALALRAHAGHARTLTAGMTKKDVAQAVFPTTTAAALTSLFTGCWPGEHGLVGYGVRDRDGDRVVNLLSGWADAGLDPLRWQPRPTVFERAREAGLPAFAVGDGAYARSGFTAATLRGAEYVAADSPADRVATAYAYAADHPGAIVSCYLPEVDKAGHRHGVASGEWTVALEEIDAALRRRIPPGVGVIVTADHGMIDVAAHRQIVLDPGDRRCEGVRHLGGEPRMLHVYAHSDADVGAVADRWRQDSERSATVITRAQAIAGGLFGPHVSSEVADRIGDVLVIARGEYSFYPAAEERSRAMIGQHGALTPEELRVPYLRWGSFAR